MNYYLYVGSYTQSEGDGIAVFHFNARDGSLKYLSTAHGVKNPSYLAIHPETNLLLAVNEVVEYEGINSGTVSSFRINPSTGALTFINKVPSGGGAPCHVSIDSNAAFALIANYIGGNFAVLPIDKEGRLSPATQMIPLEGSGPVVDRQKEPHAHAIVMDPQEKYALAVDLGSDKVISYLIDKNRGILTKAAEFEHDPGAGPRHLAFHNTGRFVFIINELNSSITTCAYNSKSGRLDAIMTADTLPVDYKGENLCADIHISKDGAYLFGSNRGHDSIVVYRINSSNGELTFNGCHSVLGTTPRNFLIDPTGQFLLVANQDSDNIVVFRIDESDGSLHDFDVDIEASKPACLKVFPMKTLASRVNL